MKAKINLGFALLKFVIRFEPDIVTARQKTRRISEALGFHAQDQARLATAVSELTRNVFQYAGTGTVEFFLKDGSPQALCIKISDNGPGINALDDILNGVYVSRTGMGVGISGSKKLMDYFDVESSPGKGTTVTIAKNFDKRARRVTKEEIVRLVDGLIAKPSESPFEEIQNQNRDLLNALEEVQAAKEKLGELNRELAETNRGVVALYAELDEKAASLQKANELKTSFLSNMTHEFRTPLSSVISLTHLLLSGVDGELTTEQRKQVQYIKESSGGLLELVNDLLDLAKVEAGKISINSAVFGIDEVLGSLRGMFRPIMAAYPDVNFVIEEPHPRFDLLNDQAKVSQILRNLIANAIKFTEKGSITLTAGLDDKDVVHFSVRDSGIGVDSMYLDVIFDDFSQVESRLQAKQKGTGLGLPLSRKLARLLGGDLHVESTLGTGSIFHVAIPRIYRGETEAVLITQQSVASSPARDLSTPDASDKFHVLIIDDDEPSRYIIKNLLNRELSATITEVEDGKVGMDYIRRLHPDLVFLDLSMPEVDGLDVLRAIRVDSSLKDIPIIVNTAKKLSALEIDYLLTEVTAVLSKEQRDDVAAISELRAALGRAGFDYKSRADDARS